jgi:Ubiquitin-like domain
LNTLVLTGNKFKRIDQNYLGDKKVEELINPYLKELILIDMALDWGQIDILAPTLVYVEQLHLVRCNCKHVSTKYQISKDYFKNLKFLNLEQNGIETWDELVGFRNLPVLKRLTVSKNKIKEIYYKPGFYDVYMITLEDNLISEWKTFDALNEFKKISVIRCGGNPVIEKAGQAGRNTVIARMQFLKSVNGSEVEIGERKDAELHYLKSSYVEYIQANKLDKRVELTDEGLMKHMNENHPRWYELVETYGSPLDIVSLKKEGTNIASTSAKIKLIGVTLGNKTLEKKLLLSMTVKDLKSMCAKLFKIEVIKSKLTYHHEDGEGYELEEDYRTLSFYSITDGGAVHVD